MATMVAPHALACSLGDLYVLELHASTNVMLGLELIYFPDFPSVMALRCYTSFMGRREAIVRGG
jgi:hypothetical protein